MTARSILLAGVALSAGMAAAPSAMAQVLDIPAAFRLCQDNKVDPDRLAFAIVGEARATAFAAYRNGDPSDLTAREARQVLAAMDAANPFGTSLVIADTEDAEVTAARGRIIDTVEAAFLGLSGASLPGHTMRYWLTSASPGDDLNPRRLFEANTPLTLHCEPLPRTGPTSSSGTTGESAGPTEPVEAGWSPRWRIRGTAADLAAQVDSLSDVEPASVGYSRDGVASTETATLKAAIGYRFEAEDGAWGLTPFLAYDYKEVTGDDDVDTRSAGILFSARGGRASGTFNSTLELVYQIDREQSSEQLKARFYHRPVFNLGNRALFGQRFYADESSWAGSGRFWLFPELTLIGDISNVRDPGSNPAFVGGGDYQGYGADLSLRMGHTHTDYDGLTFSFGRRQLWLSGDLTIDEAARRYAKLEYDFDDSPLGIALTWSEGRNDDTFKKEDTLEVQLTWRQ
jgi:hypothetical protein